MSAVRQDCPLRAQSPLRRLFVCLALWIGLMLSSSALVDTAWADGGFCSKFDEPSGLDGWGPCPPPNDNITVTELPTGGTPGGFLELRDLPNGSAACSSDAKYTGDWVKKIGECGQFCFDFEVSNEGEPPLPVQPRFAIFSASAGMAAGYVANVWVTPASGWVHICAPVKTINTGDPLPSDAQGQWLIGTSNAYNPNWNAIITSVSRMILPVDFTSSPTEVAGYDNICLTPGGCIEPPPPPPKVTGCLEDSKVEVTCNGDGTYTLTLNSSTFTGNEITLASETAGVTVTPPQQVWSASTSWTIVGATAGQTIVLKANATSVGGGSEPGTDLCCSGEITIVMPDCPKPPPLTVVKKVENRTEADLTGWTYPVTVACNPSPNTSFNLADGGTGTVIVPLGVDCKVGEDVTQVAVPAKGCPQGSTPQWSASISPSGYAHAGDTVTVLNVLECVKIEKPETAVITVEKKVANRTEGDLTGWTYPVSVACNPSPNTSFNLADGGTGSVTVPLGVDCTVSEDVTQIAVPPSACPQGTLPQWSATISPPGPAHGGDSVTVFNVLECVKIEKPETGVITVEKKVENRTEGDLTGWTYPVSVACNPSPNTSFSLTGGGTRTVNVPLGVDCTVSEDVTQVVVPSTGCPQAATPQWSTTTSPPGPAHAGDAVTVLNVLECVRPDTGVITIEKSVENATDGDLSGLEYPVTVSCNPPNTTLGLSDGGTGVVNNVPPGVDCVVTEDFSRVTVPGDACPPGEIPHWSMSISPAPPFHAGDTVAIDNIVECVRGPTTPEVICRGGSVRRGECSCPSGIDRVQTGDHAYKCVAPKQPKISCDGGRLRGGVCRCPSNTDRVQTGDHAYKCMAPKPPETICDGGRLRGGVCRCPSNTDRVQTGDHAYKCVAPKQPKISCDGGRLRGGTCRCPSNTDRVQTGDHAYECVAPKQPEISCDGGRLRGGECICGKGSELRKTGRNAFECVERSIPRIRRLPDLENPLKLPDLEKPAPDSPGRQKEPDPGAK